MHEGDRHGAHPAGSTSAMIFELFSPFIEEDTQRTDPRLLQALGVPRDVPYCASFDRKAEEDAGTTFDFHLEAPDGRRIFFDLKLAEGAFESCEDDEENRRTLERRYLPHLIEHVDTAWLLPETFAQHSGILKKLSWLGRYPASGFVFVFPKANRSLVDSENAIKRIVSKSLAPRVAILYLEFLVARILTLTEDDARLHEHYMRFKEKYVVLPAAGGAEA
jgi:hypothetical protein